MRQIGVMILITVIMLATGVIGADEITPVIEYSGVLVDEAGLNVTGTVELVVSLYDTLDAGLDAYIWQELYPEVIVEDGIFIINLGTQGNSLPIDRFTNQLWLGVRYEGNEIGPRHQFKIQPYAVNALNANDVAGQNIHPDSVYTGEIVTYSLSAVSIDVDNINMKGSNVLTGDRKLSVNSINVMDKEIVSGTYGNKNVAVKNIYTLESDTITGDTINGNTLDSDTIIAKTVKLLNRDIITAGTDTVSIQNVDTLSAAVIGANGMTTQTLHATGKTQFDAPVGIGVENPEAWASVQLDNVGNEDSNLVYSKDGVAKWDLYMDNGDKLHLNDKTGAGGAHVMTWQHDGKVGVGTVTPEETLHVKGNLKVDGVIKYNNGAWVDSPAAWSNSTVSSDFVSLTSRTITLEEDSKIFFTLSGHMAYSEHGMQAYIRIGGADHGPGIHEWSPGGWRQVSFSCILDLPKGEHTIETVYVKALTGGLPNDPAKLAHFNGVTLSYFVVATN